MNYYLEVLKKYTVFTGRATRSEYWYFCLFNMLISLAISVFFGMSGEKIGQAFSMLYGLFVFLPSIGVSIRRLHDINKSGWYLLLAFIPLIGAIWLLVLMVRDSDAGDNQYGPNPKLVVAK